MRKRNMKFMAMFLSLTMVFSMNTFALGAEASLDEIPGEAVQAEVAKGNEPEVVGKLPDVIPEAPEETANEADAYDQYETGYARGANDRATDNDVDYNDAYNEVHSDDYMQGIYDGWNYYANRNPNSSYAYYWIEGYNNGKNDREHDTYKPEAFGYDIGTPGRDGYDFVNPSFLNDYQKGFAVGQNDAQNDKNENKTTKLDEKKKDFEDPDKVAANGYTAGYQAGYFDGYAGEEHNEYMSALTAGFDAGRNAANNYQDKDSEKTVREADGFDKPYGDNEYMNKSWLAAFEYGVKAGKEMVKRNAYNAGYAAANDPGVFAQWTSADKYIASDEYGMKAAKDDNYKDWVDGCGAEYEKGLKDGYERYSKVNGYSDGMNDALFSANGGNGKAYKHVKEFASEEAIDKYWEDEKLPAANKDRYVVVWKTYNAKYESDTNGKAKDGGSVGEIYLARYKEGYDAFYSVKAGKTAKDSKKDAYNTGFSQGWTVGRREDKLRNKGEERKADEADTELDPNSYYQYYTKNDAKRSEELLKAYKEGYEFGYKAATETMNYDEGYNIGYESGAEDAQHDEYLNDDSGFYEPDYENSAYSQFNKLKDSSDFARGYVEGYLEGYNTLIAGDRIDEALAKDFDYSASTMDVWRVSTDPSKWEKSQLLINESDPGYDGNQHQSLYFDTREFGLRNANRIFRDKNGARTGVTGQIVATSPFQYYFDLYDNDHLIDKKTVSANLGVNEYDVYEGGIGLNNGSIGRYVYAAFSASSNKAKKPKKGVSDNGGTPYVIVRYRLAGAETNENYKVRRYSYDEKGNETVAIDSINNYYQGENGSEPVVPYDSRKIVGKKLQKNSNDQFMNNDKSNRYIIDAEALLITWKEGEPAKLIGSVDLNVNAKDNVNATVPHDYISFLGDSAVLKLRNVPFNHADYDPVELKQTDKPVNPAENEAKFADGDYVGFSKYYSVTKANTNGNNEKRGEPGVVTYKGATSAPKLTSPSKNGTDFAGTNAFMNKKGASPYITLKAGKLDPKVKTYSKDIKLALKNAVFNFEISRMKIASDYVSNLDTVKGNTPYNSHDYSFVYDATSLMSLIPEVPVAPKRSDCKDLADYQEKVRKYKETLEKFNDFATDKDFRTKARADLKQAIETFTAGYNELKSKYGSHLDYLQKWIEDDTFTNGNPNGWMAEQIDAGDVIDGIGVPIVAGTFPYTVTKADRTSAAGEVVPVGNTPKYRELVPEDANCDGIITAVEHYEKTELVDTWADGVDDPRFDGKLEAGDNIVLGGLERRLVEQKIDYESVEVALGIDADDMPMITFNFNSYDSDGNNTGNTVDIKYDGYGYSYMKEIVPPVGPIEYNYLEYNVYIDFLEDQNVDIETVVTFNPETVVWPAAESVATYNNENDWIDIDFTKPVYKASKPKKSVSGNTDTFMVKPVLHSEVFVAGTAGLQDHRDKSEKKLKVFAPKADKNGVVTIKKLPKADIQIEQKHAESETFVVATGINNYEGSIAIRQRKNGDLGYGYFKDDDFYYVFSDED